MIVIRIVFSQLLRLFELSSNHLLLLSEAVFKYSKERSKRKVEINLNSLPFSHVQEVGCLIYNQNYLL